MRILAVDDDESILELLSEILAAFGYTDVATAPSGREALQIIESTDKKFDCLLLDIQMPQMNGITLCEKVRTIPEYQNVPIIMLTAMVQKKYIDEAFTAGATDYVTKPFDFADLRERLSDAHRLAAERQASLAALQEMEEAGGEFVSTPVFDLQEPLRIDSVSGCLGYPEFENYVSQMSRARLFRSTAIAIKISDVNKIYNTTTSLQFLQIIETAAKAIANLDPDSGNILSYKGNGVFILVRHGKKYPEGTVMEVALDHGFSACAPSSLADFNILFQVGEDIPLRSITRSAAITSLVQAAESVENRNDTLDEVVVFPRKTSGKAGEGQDAAPKTQKAYKVLLQDTDLQKQHLTSVANKNDTSPDSEKSSAAHKQLGQDAKKPR